ncbi:helix-turn-helix domain-containing protein [Psychrobacillus psychrodurans]|uniref:helix-turn-helix domain-containing protein n=1 Tax=Psychrobacillus psychrodurans TaxID=126157 RepID=UPI0008F391F7|nr:helix-turn-helix domain-containing protein [Psychrobacillus psychrodurans]MCZ8540277.1 helix-turn-helix domain-containing protein [Psychrobacillus psychrodurans]SFM61507.1 Helix-turn-helix domain-containing protein [Psychrobacillus psychrodurans]
MTNTFNNTEPYNDKEEFISIVVRQTLQTAKQTFTIGEWMSLKEGAKYADVSYNTFMKFRSKGLKVSEVDGVRRVSRKEIDRFLENHSF